MSFSVPASLEAELDELTTHYPVQRSASLMFLHALQEHFGYISKDAVEWTARKLGLQPINVYELVTFYPMFRTKPPGEHVVSVCHNISCDLRGAEEILADLRQGLQVLLGQRGGADAGGVEIKMARRDHEAFELQRLWLGGCGRGLARGWRIA